MTIKQMEQRVLNLHFKGINYSKIEQYEEEIDKEIEKLESDLKTKIDIKEDLEKRKKEILGGFKDIKEL